MSRLGAELSAIERNTDPAARSPFGDTVAYAGVVVAAVVGVAGLVAYVWQFEDEPVVAWAFVLIGPVIGLPFCSFFGLPSATGVTSASCVCVSSCVAS